MADTSCSFKEGRADAEAEAGAEDESNAASFDAEVSGEPKRISGMEQVPTTLRTRSLKAVISSILEKRMCIVKH